MVVFPDVDSALPAKLSGAALPADDLDDSSLAWDDMDLHRWLKDTERELPNFGSYQMSTIPAEFGSNGLPTEHVQQNPSGSSPNLLEVDRLTHPDIIGGTVTPIYHAEPIIAHIAQPHIGPSALYIFGGRSPVSLQHQREDKLSRTGTGVGGSGGAEAGRVKSTLIAKAEHLIPMEAVDLCAQAITPWVVEQVERWRADEAKLSLGWAERSLKEKTTVSEGWTKALL
ncbi:hypothetical protein LTR17_016206 [Elasticomyces elasticus]|nr:hypothetical protein LTR17_016206 [Elasticomyces elasticus]